MDSHDCEDGSGQPLVCTGGFCNLGPTGSCSSSDCATFGGTCNAQTGLCTCPSPQLQSAVCGDCSSDADCLAAQGGGPQLTCANNFCQFPGGEPAGTCANSQFSPFGGSFSPEVCPQASCEAATQDCNCVRACQASGLGCIGVVDAGPAPLSCSPPQGFQGNSDGVGAYCDTNNTACPGSARCAAAEGENFCVTLSCDPTQSSLPQCGEGACCQTVMSLNVCIPTGCIGTCPNP